MRRLVSCALQCTELIVFLSAGSKHDEDLEGIANKHQQLLTSIDGAAIAHHVQCDKNRVRQKQRSSQCQFWTRSTLRAGGRPRGRSSTPSFNGRMSLLSEALDSDLGLWLTAGQTRASAEHRRSVSVGAEVYSHLDPACSRMRESAGDRAMERGW